MQNNPSLSMSTMSSCSICMPCFFPFSLSSSFETIYKRNSSYMMSPSWTLKSIGTIDTKCAMKHSFVFYIVPWERTYANYSHRQNISWWHHDFTENFPTLKKRKMLLPSFPSPTSGNRLVQLLFSQKGVCWSTTLFLLVPSFSIFSEC